MIYNTRVMVISDADKNCPNCHSRRWTLVLTHPPDIPNVTECSVEQNGICLKCEKFWHRFVLCRMKESPPPYTMEPLSNKV